MPTAFPVGASANIGQDGTSPADLRDDFADLQDGWTDGDGTHPGTGQLGIRRTFNAGAPEAFDASGEDAQYDITPLGVSVSWVSWKGTKGAMAAGSYDSALDDFISTVPAGHEVLLTQWHEPEPEPFSQAEAATFRADLRYLYNYITANKGSKNIKVGPVLMEWYWNPFYSRVGVWADFIPYDSESPTSRSAPAWDFFGIDIYDPNNNKTIQDRMETILDELVAEIDSNITGSYTRADLLWAIAETGTKRADDTSVNGAQQWFANALEWAYQEGNCLGIAWFHNDSVGGNAPWNMQDAVQTWLDANLDADGYYQGLEAGTDTLSINFENQSDNDSFTPDSGGQGDSFDTGFGTWSVDAKNPDWGDGVDLNNCIIIETDATGAAGWDTAFGSQTDIGFRTAFYMPNGLPPSGSVIIMRARESGGSEEFALRVESDGSVNIRGAASEVDSTAASTVAGDGSVYWVRGEVNTSTGAIDVWLYDSSGTQLDQLTASGLSLTTLDDFRVGKFLSSTGFHVGFLPILMQFNTTAPDIPNFSNPAIQTFFSVGGGLDITVGNAVTVSESFTVGGSMAAVAQNASNTIIDVPVIFQVGGDLSVTLTGTTVTFTPPTYGQRIGPPSYGSRTQVVDELFSLWRHYGTPIQVGWNIVISGSTVYPQFSAGPGGVDVDRIAAADTGSGENGKAWFRGGISYTITSAEAGLLRAAGYGDYLT